MKIEQAGELMLRLFSAYPQVRTSDETIGMWCMDLEPFALDAVANAVDDCRRNEDRVPSWHRFLSYVRKHERLAKQDLSKPQLAARALPLTEEQRKTLVATIRKARLRMSVRDEATPTKDEEKSNG